MDTVFLFQLATSFLVGGSIVAFLSLIAEKAPANIAGVLISLPSTQAVSLFFMGWAVSNQAVAESFTGVPAALGGSVLFVCSYIYCARLQMPKALSILFSSIVSLMLWFTCAFFIVWADIRSIAVSLLLYILLTGFSHYFLSVKLHVSSSSVSIQYSFSQKIIRAVIAGSVIAVVVLLAKMLGPFWGGIASISPAAYFCTLLIIHWHHDEEFLLRVMHKIPIASPVFIIYAFVASYTFPAFGFIFGTLVTYAVTLLYYFIILQIHTNPKRS